MRKAPKGKPVAVVGKALHVPAHTAVAPLLMRTLIPLYSIIVRPFQPFTCRWGLEPESLL